jgi:hypothetical protein
MMYNLISAVYITHRYSFIFQYTYTCMPRLDAAKGSSQAGAEEGGEALSLSASMLPAWGDDARGDDPRREKDIEEVARSVYNDYDEAATEVHVLVREMHRSLALSAQHAHSTSNPMREHEFEAAKAWLEAVGRAIGMRNGPFTLGRVRARLDSGAAVAKLEKRIERAREEARVCRHMLTCTSLINICTYVNM